jgi:hypothetical protein
MINNPFTPSLMASEPDAFFGREDELQILSRAITQGSVAIQGPVGIGKSSLLSRTLLHMDGFMSDEKCICRIAVGHSDITNVDDAARLILEELVDVDSTSHKVTFGVPNIAQYEFSEAYQHYASGRHLAALTKIIETEAFSLLLGQNRRLILAIDEADKCAPQIAQLIRAVSTKTQLRGINNIRFILAGVSPFFSEMLDTDQGVTRFIYKTINLGPLMEGEARLLLETKFAEVEKDAKDSGLELRIDPIVIERILKLSGGHPHLIQLLGSHVIEHEHFDPDGIIDSRDLMDSLRSVCYESRGPVYDTMIHRMQEEGKFGVFQTCIELAGGCFPGIISRTSALNERALELDDIEWLIDSNILSIQDNETYRIVDEFLRIRVVLDTENQTLTEIEDSIVSSGELVSYDELGFEI